MKIDKEITHVEIVESIDELNKKLEDNYILIETLKHQKRIMTDILNTLNSSLDARFYSFLCSRTVLR